MCITLKWPRGIIALNPFECFAPFLRSAFKHDMVLAKGTKRTNDKNEIFRLSRNKRVKRGENIYTNLSDSLKERIEIVISFRGETLSSVLVSFHRVNPTPNFYQLLKAMMTI